MMLSQFSDVAEWQKESRCKIPTRMLEAGIVALEVWRMLRDDGRDLEDCDLVEMIYEAMEEHKK